MTLSTLLLSVFIACNNDAGSKKEISPEMKQARADYKEIMDLKKSGDNEAALTKIEAFEKNHPKMSARIQNLKKEIEVLGKPAPKIELKTFFTGEEAGKEIDTSADTVFVVFWEKWCPHCRKELPKLESIWKDNESKGLKMMAVTQLTRGTKVEDVESLLSEHKVTYPTGHLTDRAISEAFAVKGIPAAAMVKNGKIVWRGHPAAMSAEKLSGYLTNE